MDLSRHFHQLPDLAGLKSRVPALLARDWGLPFRSLRSDTRRRLLGLTYVSVSVILGLWAHELSSSDALWRWRHQHSPSPGVWRHALESAGFQPVRSPDRIHRVMRSMPSLSDGAGSVWVDPEFCRWVIFGPLEQIQATQVYFCPSLTERNVGALPAPAWMPLGSGWQALEVGLTEIEARRPGWVRPVLARKPRTTEARDPRELRY
jgi:hypothetical protein